MRLRLHDSLETSVWLYTHRVLVESSLHYGEGTGNFKSIVHNLKEGYEGLWTVEDAQEMTKAWAVSRFQSRASDAAMICVFWLGGGDLKVIREAIPRLEIWARKQGCVGIQFRGRKGWQRVLGSIGYSPGPITMVKSLEE